MDIKLVKKLREETGAGMLECKEALEKSHDNYDEARAFLQTQITKVEGNKRVASKGLCGVSVKDNQAILFEVNAETDFVAKNEHFVSLIQFLQTHLIDSKANYPKEALNVQVDGQTIASIIDKTAAMIKENATLRRFYRIIKKDHQSFGTYVHQGGKVISVVILDQKNDLLAEQLAMQVAANTPTYLKYDLIDDQTVSYERFMFEKNHGIMDEDRFQETLRDMTLYEQPFIKDPSKSVQQLLSESKNEIIDFFRFELGQGIEDKLNCKLDIPCDGSKITVTPIYS